MMIVVIALVGFVAGMVGYGVGYSTGFGEGAIDALEKTLDRHKSLLKEFVHGKRKSDAEAK